MIAFSSIEVWIENMIAAMFFFSLFIAYTLTVS